MERSDRVLVFDGRKDKNTGVYREMSRDIHVNSHHTSPGQNPSEGHHSPGICI